MPGLFPSPIRRRRRAKRRQRSCSGTPQPRQGRCAPCTLACCEQEIALLNSYDQPGLAPVVRLLPRYDTYLLGYQKRDLTMSPLYVRRVNAGGGIVPPTLLVDGQVPGTWKNKRLKSRLDVIVEPFELLTPEVLLALEAEIRDMARFLSEEVRLHSVSQP
jgi:hypothetical protein